MFGRTNKCNYAPLQLEVFTIIGYPNIVIIEEPYPILCKYLWFVNVQVLLLFLTYFVFCQPYKFICRCGSKRRDAQDFPVCTRCQSPATQWIGPWIILSLNVEACIVIRAYTYFPSKYFSRRALAHIWHGSHGVKKRMRLLWLVKMSNPLWVVRIQCIFSSELSNTYAYFSKMENLSCVELKLTDSNANVLCCFLGWGRLTSSCRTCVTTANQVISEAPV